MTYPEFVHRIQAPDRRPDRTWLACEGDAVVGLSLLRCPPLRGDVWTACTGVVASHRGLGIARAVKLETLLQAADLGIRRVRTDNDDENPAMLHLNQTLGYHHIPGWHFFLKQLEARP